MKWQFLYKPRWLLGHLVIILFCVVFVKCAIWQYHRLEGREAANRNIRYQLAQPAYNLASINDASKVNGFRHVALNGRWDYPHTVYQRYPLRTGISGYYVLTPFLVSDGAYVINRGFITLDAGNATPLTSLQAMGVSAPVTIVGTAQDSQHSHKPINATTNVSPIPTITAVDIDRLQTVMAPDVLASHWVQLTESTSSNDPALLDGPDLTNGPHKSYMLQWIAFTILAIVGWSIVLWRESREPDPLGHASA